MATDIYEHTLASPFAAQPGDMHRKNGNTIELIRGGQVVATSTIAGTEWLQQREVLTERTINSVFELREFSMATLNVVGVTHNADGTKDIELPGGLTETWSVADLNDAAARVTEKPAMLDMLIARWKQASPTFADAGAIAGKTIEVQPDSLFTYVTIGVV